MMIKIYLMDKYPIKKIKICLYFLFVHRKKKSYISLDNFFAPPPRNIVFYGNVVTKTTFSYYQTNFYSENNLSS